MTYTTYNISINWIKLSYNINQLLNLVKLEKEESKVEKEVEEEVKEEDVKIDKDKLDLILNNKV